MKEIYEAPQMAVRLLQGAAITTVSEVNLCENELPILGGDDD